MKKITLFVTFILFIFSSSAWAVTNPDGIAVIIGNKVYQGDIPTVDYADRDAEAIKRYVLDVLGYDPENIIDLRDASKAEMEAAFGNKENHKGRLWQYLDPNGGSDILVYFSGHGVPGQNNKRSYLLPADSDPAFAEINGYPIDVLYKNISKLKARSKIVLIDACFSGASPKGMLIDSASPVFIRAKSSNVGDDLTVLTAASGDQLASWDNDAKYGLFTNYFLDAVYGKADENNDGNVSATEVKAYLDDKMTRAARRTYRRVQKVTLLGNDDRILSRFNKSSPPKRPIIEIQVVAKTPPQQKQVTPPIMSIVSMDIQMFAQKPSNVRAKPDARSPKISFLESGDMADVTASMVASGSTWYRVALADGGEGYVFGALLGDKPKPIQQASIPVVPPSRSLPSPSYVSPAGDGSNVGEVFRDCSDCPEMVIMPPGSFQMGSNSGRGDEKPVHRVTFNYSFAVGKYEVTQAQWRAVMGSNPSKFTGNSNPVEGVSWNTAKDFIHKLNALTGQRYRLLSESEWEYAARAGTTTKWSCGNSESCLNGVAWYRDNSGKQNHPVGQKQPNAFGLYDMHGNVWEWVEDCYKDSYSGASSNGMSNIPGSCSVHVRRGGSWKYLRSAIRYGYWPDLRIDYLIGFRVARTL